MDNNIDLTKLWPEFSSLTGFPQTAEQLSALFVFILLVVFLFFVFVSIKAFVKSRRQITWVFNLLKDETQTSVVLNRQEFKDKAEGVDHQGSHQWIEFDETLIEIEVDGGLQLQNTLDSSHFFNPTTLAAGITESRMLAAVPGFLTALGVIGTFVGLQLGLSELNISNGVEIEEMKKGLAHVISGASIAFMTSVWGVFLSVIFNFFEKVLENNVRKNIHRLQTRIDNLFQRLSAEYQLQKIAHNSDESRHSLQGLAEKIGEKMQESLLEVSAGIQTGLEASLEKIMSPAIQKLVDETSDGNQKALEGLVERFLDRFGEQGDQQREAMNLASRNVSDALSSLDASMAGFLEKLEISQNKSEDREKELIVTISNQVDDLVSNSTEQGKMLTEFVDNKLTGLSDLLENREKISGERDEKRQKDFIVQTSLMKASSEKMLERIESGLEAQNESTQKIINQGNILQEGIDNSVKATLDASASLQASANELNVASQQMKVFGSNIKDAGNSLAGAVTSAVESTADLASQNQSYLDAIEASRSQLMDDRELFSKTTTKLQTMLNTVETSFDKMRDQQQQFLSGLKSNIEELSEQITNMLKDYADQVNSETDRTLTNWAEHTTNYAQEMNKMAQALSNVVEEIEDKTRR